MGYWDKEIPEVEEEAAEPASLEELEKSVLDELGEVESSFRERLKRENSRFLDMCDTEYWFAVCFTSRKQKEEFMTKIGIDPELKYVEGREMAKAYRKALKTPDLEFAQIRPFDKEYLKRATDLSEEKR